MDKVAFALLKAELAERYRSARQIYERIDRRKADYQKRAESIDSMAYQLHNLYSAHEQLFEAIAQSFENRIEGSRYHTDLLLRVKLEIEGVRPALVSEEAFVLLDELRRFRHFFRHAYTAELDPVRLGALVGVADGLKDLFQRDMEAFLEKLEPVDSP